MAFYLVRYEGALHASSDLFQAAVAGSARNFMNMLARQEVRSVQALDQHLCAISPAQEKEITRRYAPQYQDFDSEYKLLNVLSEEQIASDEETASIHPGAVVIRLPKAAVFPVFQYRHVQFMKLRDFNPSRGFKYRMLPKMAMAQICGCKYVALNAVTALSERPIIITVKR
jgi:hypothetical protein